ncbi:MAG: response regulator [Gallionella sp.]|jgi:FixJ family two-component response regulator
MYAANTYSHNSEPLITPPTVYVVDDEPDMLHSLERVFRQAGLHAETFSSAAAFLDAFEPEHSGCLLLDLHMPKMNGLELQKVLLDRRCNLPIVMLTGDGDVQSAVIAIKAGAVDFLEKPLDDDALVESVRHALELDALFRASRCKLAERDARLAQLTRREREVMDKMLEGKTSKATASLLGVSVRTIEGHRAAVMQKMQANNLLELLQLINMK